MFILISLLTLGWILAILGWVFVYRIDQYWIKNFNLLIDEDNALVHNYNALSKDFNALLDINDILTASIQSVDKPQKRILN